MNYLQLCFKTISNFVSDLSSILDYFRRIPEQHFELIREEIKNMLRKNNQYNIWIDNIHYHFINIWGQSLRIALEVLDYNCYVSKGQDYQDKKNTIMA